MKIRAMILGNSGVGKTTICNQLCYNIFMENVQSTTQTEYYIYTNTDQNKSSLMIYEPVQKRLKELFEIKIMDQIQLFIIVLSNLSNITQDMNMYLKVTQQLNKDAYPVFIFNYIESPTPTYEQVLEYFKTSDLKSKMYLLDVKNKKDEIKSIFKKIILQYRQFSQQQNSKKLQDEIDALKAKQLQQQLEETEEEEEEELENQLTTKQLTKTAVKSRIDGATIEESVILPNQLTAIEERLINFENETNKKINYITKCLQAIMQRIGIKVEE